MKLISDNVICFNDTCLVYIVKNGKEAVLIDFGSGAILDQLGTYGIERISAILMTHHHRDQGQGLKRAVEANIPIHVPHTEQDLFHSVNDHWQARTIMNNYDNRQDRFSLRESVPIAGTLDDYGKYMFADREFVIVPTPGHTQGSISIFSEIDNQRIVFSGDLIAGHGKLWSLAATQWSYNGAEGVAASIPSLLELKKLQPDFLLPSHGETISEVEGAIDALVEKLAELLQHRGHNLRLFELMKSPYREITPHLLFNRTSMSNSYVVLSESGKSLIIDFGYDFITGIPLGSDRTSRRPWLYTLDKLKEQYGVTDIDVVMPTHFHDDHVAGINLLRQIEGTQCWAARNFSDILEHPTAYDLPCLWYDPISVDRVLDLETPIQWEEYTFTLHELSGHTRYAVAIEFEIDGKRVLATGDQYQGNSGDEYNHVFNNDYQLGDYLRSASLYRKLQPDIIITGHWEPQVIQDGYFDHLDKRGEALERLHKALLPLDEVNLGARGTAAIISPYQIFASAGESFDIQVDVRNPFNEDTNINVHLALPDGWTASPGAQIAHIKASGSARVHFIVTPTSDRVRRARITADITVDSQRFGEQAEALVTLS